LDTFAYVLEPELLLFTHSLQCPMLTNHGQQDPSYNTNARGATKNPVDGLPRSLSHPPSKY
jgi:hypothetical protein